MIPVACWIFIIMFLLLYVLHGHFYFDGMKESIFFPIFGYMTPYIFYALVIFCLIEFLRMIRFRDSYIEIKDGSLFINGKSSFEINKVEKISIKKKLLFIVWIEIQLIDKSIVKINSTFAENSAENIIHAIMESRNRAE